MSPKEEGNNDGCKPVSDEDTTEVYKPSGSEMEEVCSSSSSSNKHYVKDDTASTATFADQPTEGQNAKTAYTLDVPSSTINQDFIRVQDFQFPKAAQPIPYLQGQGGYAIAIAAFIACTTANIATRLSVARNDNKDDQGSPASMWSYFAIELVQLLFFTGFSLLLCSPHKKRKRYRLMEDCPEVSYPRVDIFLPMCKEDLQIQTTTIQAALAMNYPRSKLRIYVLDDGGSDDLKDWCEDHFAKSTCVVEATYVRRYKDPTKPHGAKAGNLNNCLELSKIDDDILGGETDEEHYGAVFDADMIAVPDFLRRMVPHLMKDKKMAIAQSAIRFYNLPYGDPISQDLCLYYDVLEPRKDALGAAWCLGTGFIFRRCAVEEVGGFPTSSVTEDMNLSFYLVEKGWKLAYVQEDLQIGAQPDSLAGHIRQRARWCVGAIQAAFEHKGILRSPGAMTGRQKCSNMIFTYCYFMISFITLTNYALPIVLLCTNGQVLPFATRDDITLQLRLNSVVFLSFKVMGYMLGGHIGLLRLQREYQWMHFLGPYFFKSLLRHYVVPNWAGGHKKKFKASGGSQCQDDQERYPEHRTSLCRRIWYFMFKQGLWVHTLFLLLLSAALIRRTVLVLLYPTEFASDLVELVRNETGDPDALPTFFDLFFLYVSFPPIWFILVAQYYLPVILYAFFPPANTPMPSPPDDMISSLQKGDGGKYYVAKHTPLLTAIYELPGALMSLMCVIVLILV